MFQSFEPGEERFRGQRLLVTALLLVLALSMVVLAVKQIAAGQLFESDFEVATGGIVPVQLALPGGNFETHLTEASVDGTGQLTGTGWLKTSPRPGENGVSVIVINPDWPVANLKAGDRLEIDGNKNEKLVFEVTANPVAENVSLKAGTTPAFSELKLVVLNSVSGITEKTIAARLVTVSQG